MVSTVTLLMSHYCTALTLVRKGIDVGDAGRSNDGYSGSQLDVLGQDREGLGCSRGRGR
jgi:hypothetical protein